MSIFLVRHGETSQNAARVLQLPDSRLSMQGQLQAERLAERVAGLGIVRILSSDLIRAVETAERASARTGAAIELTPVLQERNFGDLRGQPYSELGLDPFAPDYAPPNGESWAVFHARVEGAWAQISAAAAEVHGNLLVVTHGLVCGALVSRHMQVPPEIQVPRSWANTGLAEIEAVSPWLVRRLNCCAHLGQGASAPE